ncbi:MAG: sigma-70 family RNA polymerase sigma factor [Kineosporiaceae bacterium]
MNSLSDTGDRHLWQRAAAGETACFGELFDRHASAVHAYCRARHYGSGADGGDASDLVSVVFLEAWRRRRDVVLHEESALPWLLGVARRVLQHRARTLRRHRAALARLPAADIAGATPVPDPADEIAARLDDTARLAALTKAFERLRPADREVLTLCVWGGLDPSAAAVVLGAPAVTVRSRLSRARARLAALTTEEAGVPAAPSRTRAPRLPQHPHYLEPTATAALAASRKDPS